MSLRLIFVTFLLWSLAINQSFGQQIADFTFDDKSNEPASLLINRIGEDAISINPNARSDGEGVYTIVDQDNPDVDQNIDLKIPRNLLSGYPSIYLEWEFRCQEDYAWLINGGDNYHSGIYHDDTRGFNIRYYTQANPDAEPTFFHTEFNAPQIPPLERDKVYTVVFHYNQDEGIAYLLVDDEEIWRSTDHFDATPGEELYWHTQEDNLTVGYGMNGDGSTIPSLYRFRIYEQPCPDMEVPDVDEGGTTQEVCPGETATLKVMGGEEGNYRWYESQNAYDPIAGATASEFTTGELNESTSFFVSYTDGDCESDRLEIRVDVIEPPSPPEVEGEPVWRCTPGVLTLEVSGGTDGNYRWYESEDATTPISDAVDSRLTTGHLSQNTTFYVATAGGKCESDRVPVEALIYSLPAKPADQEIPPLCGPGEVVIELDNINPQHQYRWYSQPDANMPLDENNEGRLVIEASQDTVIYVRSSNGYCESEPAAISIRVNPLPQIEAGPDTTILRGQRITLEAETGNYAFHWEPHESLDDPNASQPTVTPEFTHIYVLTATTDNGCEVSDTVTVYVIDDFPVPNAFSPNDDGRNDLWEIPNIENYPNCRVVVFNRWGNQVFSSDGYTEPWDGTNRGKPLANGTYYYIIQLNNEREAVKGSVLIIR